MNNYWLIPMDFEKCNFEQMEIEWNKNKKIMWEVPGTPQFKKKTNNWVINKKAKMPRLLKNGDIVYFYVKSIPSNSGDKKSRILLRGVIEDEPYPIEFNKVYWNSDESKMIIGFSIGNITTLPKDKLENDLFLSYDELKLSDREFLCPRGMTNWPNTCRGNLSKNLIDLLENTFKKNSYKDDFKALINHFNQECFFCGKLGTKSDHKTFKRKNGTDYYEYHHFIQQHKGKKLLELKNIIDAPENKICLCSNCHNKIHYGKIDEVNNMIDLIWNDEKIQNMLDMYQFSSIIGEDTLSWIKDVYISNSEFSKKNNDNVG